MAVFLDTFEFSFVAGGAGERFPPCFFDVKNAKSAPRGQHALHVAGPWSATRVCMEPNAGLY